MQITKRGTVVAIIIGILAILSLAIIWVSGNRAQQNISLSVEKQYLDVEAAFAEDIAHTFEKEIQSMLEELSLITQIPAVKNGSTKSCNTAISEAYSVMKTPPGNILRTDSKGVFDCAADTVILGINALQLEYVNTIFRDPKHLPHLSRMVLFICPLGIARHIVALHVPRLLKDGSFQGTLGAAIYFEELFSRYLRNIHMPEGAYVVILDDNGDVLYHPDNTFVSKNISSLAGRTATEVKSEQAPHDCPANISRVLNQGGKQLAACMTASVLPGRNWTVAVVTPASVVNRSFGPMLAQLKLQTFLTILLLILFVIGIGRFFLMSEIGQLRAELQSIAAHQLKAPLTAIKMFGEMLLDDYAKQLNDKMKEMVVEIKNTSERMIGTVSELMEASKLEQGSLKVVLSTVDIGALMKEILAQNSPLALENGTTVTLAEVPSKLSIRTDATLLRHAVNNLVANAIQYCKHSGGRVTISIQKQANGTLLFQVQDNGIGIPNSAKRRMFKKFARADNACRHQISGTGLGLYLVRMIVKKLGGSIWFESQESIGTTFSFTLPQKQ